MLYYKYNEGEIMIKTVRDINLNNKKVAISMFQLKMEL